jgi:hypothetical protein
VLACEIADEPGIEGTGDDLAVEEQPGKEGSDPAKSTKAWWIGESLSNLGRAATRGLGRAARGLVSGAISFVSEAIEHVTTREETMAVYSKEKTIVIPHNNSPKTYHLLIRHIDIQHQPKLKITISTKTTGRCAHKNTSLFMRFV